MQRSDFDTMASEKDHEEDKQRSENELTNVDHTRELTAQLTEKQMYKVIDSTTPMKEIERINIAMPKIVACNNTQKPKNNLHKFVLTHPTDRFRNWWRDGRAFKIVKRVWKGGRKASRTCKASFKDTIHKLKERRAERKRRQLRRKPNTPKIECSTFSALEVAFLLGNNPCEHGCVFEAQLPDGCRYLPVRDELDDWLPKSFSERRRRVFKNYITEGLFSAFKTTYEYEPLYEEQDEKSRSWIDPYDFNFDDDYDDNDDDRFDIDKMSLSHVLNYTSQKIKDNVFYNGYVDPNWCKNYHLRDTRSNSEFAGPSTSSEVTPKMKNTFTNYLRSRDDPYVSYLVGNLPWPPYDTEEEDEQEGEEEEQEEEEGEEEEESSDDDSDDSDESEERDESDGSEESEEIKEGASGENSSDIENNTSHDNPQNNENRQLNTERNQSDFKALGEQHFYVRRESCPRQTIPYTCAGNKEYSGKGKSLLSGKVCKKGIKNFNTICTAETEVDSGKSNFTSADEGTEGKGNTRGLTMNDENKYAKSPNLTDDSAVGKEPKTALVTDREVRYAHLCSIDEKYLD